MGRVLSFIKKEIEAQGALHFTLIDPEEEKNSLGKKIAKKALDAGTDAFLVGGSLGVDAELLNRTINQIRDLDEKIPIILFPGDINCISPLADAIFYMSLLNSRNPYYIIDAQAKSSIIIKRMKLEAIPMAYLITEPGQNSAAGWIGDVKPLPKSKPYLTASYALAAEMLGLKLVYLEAGSGAENSVPNEIVNATRKLVSIPIIVGGGIRDPKVAVEKIKAGADIIVTGTIGEKDAKRLSRIIKEIKKEGERRY